MKSRLSALLLVSCALAAGEPTPPPVKPQAAVKTQIVPATEGTTQPKVVIVSPAAAKIPAAENAIPDAVKALGEPLIFNFPEGIRTAVTAATEKAQLHVNQGLNHLHGGWEFEASRHFATAIREDPECLLAHWGMLMSLLTPSPENDKARVAVTARLLDLVDAGKGTELERGYAFGLIKYIEEGPSGATIAFHKVAAEFPNDLQAGIFAALFGRGGYDDLGKATPDQEVAEKSLLAMVAKNPQSPLPLHALLTIRAEAPDLSDSLELARKLCQMAPDYPPYFHLLGHYEWRCGHHAKATSAFGRASSFYETWMRENKATVADCPEWVKSECYRIVALASKGDFDTAYAAARQIAATSTPKDRASSPGARLLIWDAKTLPARVLLRRSLRGNAKEASRSLPTPAEIKDTRDSSLAFWWIDGLRLALEARQLLDEGKISQAREVVAAITYHGEAMSKSQAAAAVSGERSAWTRGFRAMEVLASELRGQLTLAGPKAQVGTAYNWFASATDRQLPAPMMFPPMNLTPMAIHLGEYYLAVEKPQEAIAAFQRALTSYPNDINALLGLKTAFQQAKQPADVTATQQKIDSLRSE